MVFAHASFWLPILPLLAVIVFRGQLPPSQWLMKVSTKAIRPSREGQALAALVRLPGLLVCAPFSIISPFVTQKDMSTPAMHEKSQAGTGWGFLTMIPAPHPPCRSSRLWFAYCLRVGFSLLPISRGTRLRRCATIWRFFLRVRGQPPRIPS